MPVVIDFGRGRIKVKIYFKDHGPPHVHVDAPGASAVFDIGTLECLECSGFSKGAIGKIKRELESRKDFLKEKWDEYSA